MSLNVLTNPHLVAAVTIVLSLSPGLYVVSTTEQSATKVTNAKKTLKNPF